MRRIRERIIILIICCENSQMCTMRWKEGIKEGNELQFDVTAVIADYWRVTDKGPRSGSHVLNCKREVGFIRHDVWLGRVIRTCYR